jgi:HD-GYP domain-containing protein (c-di-GMP phosphodiesterase class II)
LSTASQRPGERRPRLPLFVFLLVAVLLVTLAPFGVFALITVREMKQVLVTVQQERQLEMAAGAVQRLDAFLAQEGREAVKLGESVGMLARAGVEPQRDLLRELLDETIVLVRFHGADGRRTQAVVPELVVSSTLEQALEREAKALFEQGAAPQPPSARSAFLGGPHLLGPERVLAVTVSAPVQRQGRVLGVLQEVALFQSMWQEAAEALPPGTRLFLLDAEGEVVAMHGVDRTETPESVTRREIVQQFVRSRGVSRGARAYATRGANGEVRRCLGSFATTSHSWGVIVEIDEELAFAPVRQLTRRVAVGSAAAAGLALVVALLLGGMISRPMRRLAAISQRIAGGDFSVQARSSRVLELDQLAGNFNRMAGRLGELVERFRTAAREANAMFLGTIRALAEAIDEKDPYTKGHSIRVNRYAVIVGRYLGLSREALRDLHVSSLLHDVGKIGIDDAILKKPAALTPAEFDVMKTHPPRGAKIMGRIPQMQGIIPGMRYHHERWSGGGYPQGLKEKEIPLQARIIAVADTFDAMTTDRPYQVAFTFKAAVERINDLRGVSFDPEVVDAFNRAFEAGELAEVLREHGATGPDEPDEDAPPPDARAGGPASEVTGPSGSPPESPRSESDVPRAAS